VVCEGQTPPDRTLEQAAILAATHSKAADSVQVPVDYTYARFVKKPSGAKPGMVIYTDNRTAYVNPDHTLVERLKTEE
jgi:predicted ribosome quality control (RQC) complex YloA/Tae2 family protein